MHEIKRIPFTTFLLAAQATPCVQIGVVAAVGVFEAFRTFPPRRCSAPNLQRGCFHVKGISSLPPVEKDSPKSSFCIGPSRGSANKYQLDIIRSGLSYRGASDAEICIQFIQPSGRVFNQPQSHAPGQCHL